MKLSLYFTALGNIARQLDDADKMASPCSTACTSRISTSVRLTVSPQEELSTSAELLLRLRWIAEFYGQVRPSLPLSGGVDAA